MDVYHFTAGHSPLLLSIPHAGTFVPGALAQRFTPAAQALPDTDWHLERLYGFAANLGASVLRANYSRYVIDLNRPPDDAPLYSTATTGLCPTTLFDGTPLYEPGCAPTPDEVADRTHSYWRPYHDCLQQTLARLRQEHGFAVLFDAHSICSTVPRLFSGQLPDFNMGTFSGKSCAPAMAALAVSACEAAKGYSTVLNGRFKGGYITRYYGQPEQHHHALQLELSQRTYMHEAPPFAYRKALACAVQPVLENLLTQLIHWSPAKGV